MSDEWAIRVERLSKKYVIRHQQQPYVALRDVAAETAKSVVRRVRSGLSGLVEPRSTAEEFWALQDVSFDVKAGEVVGIIGRNGAGKSTLLKVLSRITEPTTGRIEIRGRIASLLEVGTGFHPELTGRENIFLNGAILGMSRSEIARKFDQIVDFSGVEAFIDTPVKRYSSGMQTRLAFSVAAHLDPEILIIDEVLAVGDAEFQKKCLGKMNDVSKSGRTILFVSHNMGTVNQLCDRIIWLDKGKVILDSSDTFSATNQYLFTGVEDIRGEILAAEAPLETEFFDFCKMRVCSADGVTICNPVSNSTSITLEIELDIEKSHSSLSVGYAVFNEVGETVYWSIFTDSDETIVSKVSPGRILLSTVLPKRLLNEGSYRIDFISSLHFMNWFSAPGETKCAVYLRIEGGLSDSSFFQARRPGVIAPVFPWILNGG